MGLRVPDNRGIWEPPLAMACLVNATLPLNFGQQQRWEQERRIYTEILSWFDLAAVQEVKENFGDLFDTSPHGQPVSDPHVECGGE